MGSRQLQDNLQLLMQVAQKLDEEVRTKTAQFNEAKTSRGNISKKDGATLATSDLQDILVPAEANVQGAYKVKMQEGNNNSDFFYTEHLTTVCVIVPRGGGKDFEKKYESFSDMVVPGSAKKFDGLDDKDGNSLWRVVVFKAAVDAFKKACRENRYGPRDLSTPRPVTTTWLSAAGSLMSR